jgi:hypothetical protein
MLVYGVYLLHILTSSAIFIKGSKVKLKVEICEWGTWQCSQTMYSKLMTV